MYILLEAGLPSVSCVHGRVSVVLFGIIRTAGPQFQLALSTHIPPPLLKV